MCNLSGPGLLATAAAKSKAKKDDAEEDEDEGEDGGTGGEGREGREDDDARLPSARSNFVPGRAWKRGLRRVNMAHNVVSLAHAH